MRYLFSLLIFLAVPLYATTQDVSHLDLTEVVRSAPVIYGILFLLSFFSFSIWLYSLLTLRTNLLMPRSFIEKLRHFLLEKKYDLALDNCKKARHFTASILASGLVSRGHGHQIVVEAMQTEGKRCGVILWQRISLINDVAIIAPMLGLLGTVLGLFYAFYDVNRSADTLASIFDGLGIAVGTTVAGLVVAIMAMIFYATLKFRVIRVLNMLENETLALGHLIEVE
ncbi:MAG: MotA/TolQ/ExbB proton channel family protein [Verrucomicrobia bacterium]|nr:MotA/TolQ/ExbB proton channel family protein [Verrucomicrobiota bacterium]MBS0645949.1 MotA/TolQ/ExbB proton channel family protein [Verrucomicrobiota bacterium]